MSTQKQYGTSALSLLIHYSVIRDLVFFLSGQNLFLKEMSFFLLYIKINVGEMSFLTFSKSIMLYLEKRYFVFSKNQTVRCGAFLCSLFTITQNLTVPLLGKG